MLIYTGSGIIIDLLGHFMDGRLPKDNYVVLDGTVTGMARQITINQFKTDPTIRVMPVNYLTGSMGLDLPVANNVISLERWFNDMVNDQSDGRVIRPGQTRDVHLWKLFRQNTVDERIKNICDKKSREGHNFLNGRNTRKARRGDEAGQAGGGFTINMIASLFQGNNRFKDS